MSTFNPAVDEDGFKKSSWSVHNPASRFCVAVKKTDDAVLVRDTKDPAKTTLSYTGYYLHFMLPLLYGLAWEAVSIVFGARPINYGIFRYSSSESSVSTKHTDNKQHLDRSS